MELDQKTINKSWDRICKKFQFSHGQGIFTSWIKPLSIRSFDKGFVTIAAPTRFIKDWVTNNFSGTLEEYLKEEFEEFKGFAIEIKSSQFTKTEDHISAVKNDAEDNKETVRPSYGFESVTDEKFCFKNFIHNETNQFAFNACKAISDINDKNYGLFKSLYVYGSHGNGKTHLLQSIANSINDNDQDNRTAIYLSAEKFMYGFMKSLQERNIISFKEYIRSADVLLMDDIQFICGKQNIQEEFLHSFNAIVESGNSVILSSDRLPEKLKDIDDRLKARICSGITADIKKPDFSLRLAFLKDTAKKLKVEIDDQILSYIAKEITSSIREVEGALNRILAKSSLSGSDITMENVIAWIGDMIVANTSEITIDKIKKTVCENFGLGMKEIDAKTKSREIARPRQIAMYLSKKLTTKSLPEIGRNFGGKDHATVVHSIKAVEKLIVKNSEINSIISELKSSLQQNQ